MGCVRVTMLFTPEGWALCSAKQWRRAELLPRHAAPNACLRPLWSHVFREHGKVSWWGGGREGQERAQDRLVQWELRVLSVTARDGI